MNVTRYACAGLLLTVMLGGEGQAQEDPYFEWLKQQGGQQQPTPAPEILFPQTPPPAETPAPAPSPAPSPAPAPERYIASYSDGGYSVSFVIAGTRLERRTSNNGVPARSQWVELADIEVIEIGECAFTVRARVNSVTYLSSDGGQSRGRYLEIVSDLDADWDEAKAIADRIIAAVGVPTVDVGDEDCWW